MKMKKIPLEVSSKQANLPLGVALVASPYVNATGITTEAAPLLLSVKSVRTVDADEFATRMITIGGQGTQAQARLALNAVAMTIEDLVREFGAITVVTPFGTVETFIAGTLENPQDQPDREKNFAFLSVIVPEAYRRKFAEMEAYVPTEAYPVALKRVRDKATNAKGIRGTEPFYLEGRGMTIGGAGETLELLDAVTRDKLCDISVDAESKSTVQFLCTLSPQTAIEKGDYLVRLTTLAGGEATLWPVELKVELVEAVPAPEPVPLAQSVSGDIKIMSMDAVGSEAPWAIHGLNVGLTSDDEPNGIVDAVATVGGKTLNWANDATSFEAETAYFSPSGSGDLPPAGEYVADLTFHRTGGSEGSENLVVHDVTITVS